jgi:hypothetical protein
VAEDGERKRAEAELREAVPEDLDRMPDRVEQLAVSLGHGTASEVAWVAWRSRPRSGDCASVKTGTARPPANDVEM